MTAERLDVSNKIGVVLPASSPGQRASASSLIEDDDSVIARIEKTAMRRGRTGSWAAMQEQHRRAPRVARLLPVHDVGSAERQPARRVRLDLGKKIGSVVTGIHRELAPKTKILLLLWAFDLILQPSSMPPGARQLPGIPTIVP